MKRPSFQFYPGDWQVNSNLRRCSHAEKGVWLDILCLFHDAPEYGVLRWPLKEIAQAVGAPLATVKGLLTKGVLKGDDKRLSEPFTYTPRSGRKDGETVTLLDTQDGPIWFSSRMVRDEYIRTHRGEGTRFGDDNDAPPKRQKSSPKPPFGDGKSAAPKPAFGDGSSSSSSSSSSNTTHTMLDQSPGGTGVPEVCVSICQKMQECGVKDANASDVGLAVLVGKGADVSVFIDAAKVAVGQGKGFAYALGVVKNKMTAADALVNVPMAVPQKGAPARSKFDPEPARVSDVWHESAGGVDRKAAELGLPPIGPFEQWPSFRARVMAAANRPRTGMDLGQLAGMAAARQAGAVAC